MRANEIYTPYMSQNNWISQHLRITCKTPRQQTPALKGRQRPWGIETYLTLPG